VPLRHRLLLFDIDGTLVNTLGAGRSAIFTAMTEVYGETGPIDGFRFHGKTDPAIVRGLLRAAGHGDTWIERGFDRLWERYYEELENELAARDGRVFTYPGVTDLLERLGSDDRFCLGLVTGNMERGAWQKLRACGLDDHFGFGAFGSDSEHREDLPPLARDRAEASLGRSFVLGEAIVVGDTPEDINCARVSGARVLAVATGRNSIDELAEHNPDAVVSDLSDTNLVMRILSDD
jgi:phosphoglycolate phosphatase-like HAD superfamily hydrolase